MTDTYICKWDDGKHTLYNGSGDLLHMDLDYKRACKMLRDFTCIAHHHIGEKTLYCLIRTNVWCGKIKGMGSEK